MSTLCRTSTSDTAVEIQGPTRQRGTARGALRSHGRRSLRRLTLRDAWAGTRGRIQGAWQIVGMIGEQWRAEREERALIRVYLSLDDTLLDDIGLVRADVTSALRLPRSHSAAREIEQAIQRNREIRRGALRKSIRRR